MSKLPTYLSFFSLLQIPVKNIIAPLRNGIRIDSYSRSVVACQARSKGWSLIKAFTSPQKHRGIESRRVIAMGCLLSTPHPIFKSDLPKRIQLPLPTADTQPHPTFALFPNLPAEIRLKIWSLASSVPRNVHITVSFSKHRWSQQSGGYRFEHDYCWWFLNPVPSVLHTSCEARREALLHYRLGFGSQHDLMATYSTFETDHDLDADFVGTSFEVDRTDNQQAKVYFNPASDTICISAQRSGQLPMSGLLAILRECAGNGSRFLALRLSPSIEGYMRHADEWAHLSPLGLVSWLPWKDTKIESVIFYNKDEELDIPRTRGGLTLKHLDIVAGDEVDMAAMICGMRDELWKYRFNNRWVRYLPEHGSQWPDIEVKILYLNCSCHSDP